MKSEYGREKNLSFDKLENIPYVTLMKTIQFEFGTYGTCEAKSSSL